MTAQVVSTPIAWSSKHRAGETPVLYFKVTVTVSDYLS